ncbi:MULTISPECIES: urease accessory protein UreD [unclassified Streptomyces]|uniref:Urease accessory protein UreD n=1 Tax=Streptomyces flavovirens TaxID=52258 RepID=A0ABV8N7X2_9ACTN|nr:MULTISPECIES: urease accessory protein UreD [unclassified Streptomyces]MYR65329.1 urease accessory protein UreD [Streptomyces sp. SID4939]MYT67324.1 urease accessory protein UreD [Streptomyces sp. SID8357]MYT87990.1 urease accessory protein UreD [Streptomyces sp. SID8360]MYU32266.1 urease accessory protein UreD [Streptomyces sp. SID8358]MYW40676.1 urease accessory protein UreD [Streptomyces sp. SID1]MYX75937.1 urease accessory protein UreD [Streptomyces sp. SID3915]
MTRPDVATVVTVRRDASGRDVASELAPGTFLAPRPLLPAADGLHLALVGTTAGLLAGDDLLLRITVGPGARLRLREPAGLVAYDHRGGTSSWRAVVEVAEGGELTWESQPFVVSSGAAVTRTMQVALAPGARMLWRDTLVLGRSGERGGGVRALTRAVHGGRELLVEDLDLTDPDVRELPGILGPNRIVGAVTALGADPGGPPHPSRMDLAGPGAQIRLLDTRAPAVDRELTAVWRSWRASYGTVRRTGP